MCRVTKWLDYVRISRGAHLLNFIMHEKVKNLILLNTLKISLSNLHNHIIHYKNIRNNRNHNLLLHFWFSPRIKTYLCTFYFGRPISSAYTRNFLRSILGNGRCYLRQQRDWFVNQKFEFIRPVEEKRKNTKFLYTLRRHRRKQMLHEIFRRESKDSIFL